ncbi:MAG: Gfo/Idh/MocA family oxidoreductase [Planctomycetia bacterium]|nr:Gfo/Idh/MocA family oxidoreductase [Planctomycetia bacterium]
MPSRRHFVMTTAGTALGWAASSHANCLDRIRIGLIGTGGRCRHLLQTLMKSQNAEVVAIADVWDGALAATQKQLGREVVADRDGRRILDRKDIQAVLIATPDHLHVPWTIAACQAGKDVYVEKPLTHNLEEGQSVIDAQNQHQRIVQVGMQQRSMPHLIEAYEQYVKAGKLGQIFKAHLSWNRWAAQRGRAKYDISPNQVDWKAFLGTAREQPFDAYRMREWRWFWDFGGGLFTDLMVHFLDVFHWMAGVSKPSRAWSMGSSQHSQGDWETPDTVQTLLEYPRANQTPIQVHYEGTFSNAHYRAMLTLMGTKGTLYLDRGRYEFQPEGGGPLESKVLATKPTYKGADFYDKPDGELVHLENWLACIQSRKAPTAPAETGVASAAAAHLANMALRSGNVASMPGK